MLSKSFCVWLMVVFVKLSSSPDVFINSAFIARIAILFFSGDIISDADICVKTSLSSENDVITLSLNNLRTSFLDFPDISDILFTISVLCSPICWSFHNSRSAVPDNSPDFINRVAISDIIQFSRS